MYSGIRHQTSPFCHQPFARTSIYWFQLNKYSWIAWSLYQKESESEQIEVRVTPSTLHAIIVKSNLMTTKAKDSIILYQFSHLLFNCTTHSKNIQMYILTARKENVIQKCHQSIVKNSSEKLHSGVSFTRFLSRIVVNTGYPSSDAQRFECQTPFLVYLNSICIIQFEVVQHCCEQMREVLWRAQR